MHGLLHQAVTAQAVEEAATRATCLTPPGAAEGARQSRWLDALIAAMEVVAAPGPLTIDGDLSEWDLSGRFEARCADPFAKSYDVQGAMMHDAQSLYIAARVGDPMPMRSVIDPSIDPWSAWMGGGLHLHLCTDRTFGWLLKAQWPAPGRQASVQDISQRIVHLFLWSFQPREQPCLGVRYGMKLVEIKNPPYAGRGKDILTFMNAEAWGKTIYR